MGPQVDSYPCGPFLYHIWRTILCNKEHAQASLSIDGQYKARLNFLLQKRPRNSTAGLFFYTWFYHHHG